MIRFLAIPRVKKGRPDGWSVERLPLGIAPRSISHYRGPWAKIKAGAKEKALNGGRRG